jgi:alpha-glucosidase
MVDTKKEEFAVEIMEESLDGNIQHVNNPVLDLPQIEKKYLRAIVSYVKEDNSYIFSDGRARVEVRIFTDEIIRVRLAPQGVFLDDFSYAVVDIDEHANAHHVSEDATAYHISTASVVCTINKKNFLVSFSDKKGKVMNTDYAAMHWEENPDFGGYYVYCTKQAFDDEVFFGCGDKASNLNLRGRRVQNWNSDTYSYAFNQDPLYKTIPFYLGVTGGDAYGIFFDNTFKTYFDFAGEHSDQTSFWSEGGELQYYYIHGPKLVDVVKRYHTLTGTHYLPPVWALGYHQCRWSYYPENKVRQVADEFRKRKSPVMRYLWI